MIIKNVSYFQEKENLGGKQQVILIIDCNRCIEKDKDFIKNRKCLYCLLYHIYLNKNRKFNYISILYNDILIESHQFNVILDYFKKLKKIKKLIQKVKNIRTSRCSFVEFRCNIFSHFSTLSKIHEIEYYDPIFTYSKLLKLFSDLKKIKFTNSICQKCQIYFENLLRSILNIFKSLKLVKEINSNQRKNNYLIDFLFSKTSYLVDTTHEIQELEIKDNHKLLVSYQTGKHKLYNVYIYQKPWEEEKYYRVKTFFEREANKDYIEKVIFNIIQNFETPELNRIVPLEHLIELYENKSKELLNSKYSFSEPNLEKIGLIIALKKLQLNNLYPLLIDDFIEEIFLDSPNDKIYLNHQKYGRCRTDIGLNLKEIERVKTLFRLYSGKRLDYMNPSIKLVLKNKYFYCRFAIDVEPIQIHKFAMDIRKLNRNIFTIQDLLKNETLDSRMAAFLYFNISRKRNITITGETDTGKTTLINAFDLLTPKEFRKIYVENVTESLKQLDFGKHQLKYRVDSLEEPNSQKYSKSNIIKTLLHRTPDIIYLGEILTKEETEAMFHCLAVGLKGFQTIHAENIDSLINRFLHHFKINKSCLSDLDLIVLMKKEFNERRVVSVSEINFNKIKDKDTHDLIFAYNPSQKKWDLQKPLYETKVITELCKYENLSKEKFISILNIYTNIFSIISKIDKLDKIELIDLFHKISYISSKSINSLNQFWSDWKKTRSLNL